MEATPGLVRALRADSLGTWLPYALADLLGAVLAARGGHPPRTADVLSAWGLQAMAGKERDADTDRALEAMRRLGGN